jgi:hypothetical protein
MVQTYCKSTCARKWTTRTSPYLLHHGGDSEVELYNDYIILLSTSPCEGPKTKASKSCKLDNWTLDSCIYNIFCQTIPGWVIILELIILRISFLYKIKLIFLNLISRGREKQKDITRLQTRKNNSTPKAKTTVVLSRTGCWHTSGDQPLIPSTNKIKMWRESTGK